MSMLPSSATRVPTSTSEEHNERIRHETEVRVRYYARHPELIDSRIEELDHEWDIERAIEANSSSLVLAGLGLGAFVDRRFLVLPALVAGFLLQHALQGWCPPVPFFRKRGFRTPNEIERERAMLRALRGDFDGLRMAARQHERPEEHVVQGTMSNDGK